MPELFKNKVMPPLRNILFLTALERLLTLLTSASNQCIDTEAEVKFLLNYLHDSIDTLLEIKELMGYIEKLKNHIPEVVNNPELKTAINDLINKLEAAGRQNRPGF